MSNRVRVMSRDDRHDRYRFANRLYRRLNKGARTSHFLGVFFSAAIPPAAEISMQKLHYPFQTRVRMNHAVATSGSNEPVQIIDNQ
jgi:hypothetical protein